MSATTVVIVIVVAIIFGLIIGGIIVAISAKKRARRHSDDNVRRADSSLALMLNPDQRAEIDALIASKKFIPAVNRVRQFTGLNLKDSRRLVDALRS